MYEVVSGSQYEYCITHGSFKSVQDAIALALWLVHEYNVYQAYLYIPYEKYDEFAVDDKFELTQYPKMLLDKSSNQLEWVCEFDFVEIIKQSEYYIYKR